ncbi:MAG TPA: glycosyltransferase family 4 protein [Candidatus Acidoferrales bacterium]|jgi:glycosyltransferase involved in cell wall biosynthesis|nr:glycosyltransferase family 4 protein [Candidatus Acidoferrales bacterium]
MRILHLDTGKEMRGGQWQVLRLIEGLSQAGVESTLLAPEDALLFAAARDKGWRVEPLSLVRALLAARRYDLVHAHDARSHTLAALIGVMIPVVPKVVPLVVSRRVAFAVRSRWKYRRPTRFIAVSEYVKSVLLQGGVPAGKISVVYDGVPLLQVSTRATTNITVLAKATGQSHDRRSQSHDRQGVVVPGVITALASAAAELAGVTLRPTVNLERDLRDAGVLLYLSDSEGLGSGALLAMSAGVPVIASKVGGLLEVIRDGENGILVPNEPTAIAAAIKRLLASPDLVGRLGRAARQTVMDRFTVDQMVRHTMEVYRQVLSLD